MFIIAGKHAKRRTGTVDIDNRARKSELAVVVGTIYSYQRYTINPKTPGWGSHILVYHD